MKTAELTGATLDWAVAKCEGYEINKMHAFDGERACMGVIGHGYSPSTDWAQGGPIIEREELSVEPLYTAEKLDCWQAYGHNLRYDDNGNYINGSDHRRYGPSPLIAAMRCYVASKLGDEIDIPEALK